MERRSIFHCKFSQLAVFFHDTDTRSKLDKMSELPMADLLRRIGVEVPIIQAPMAGISTPAMAAAVTNAGGLGSIAVGAVNAEGARSMIKALQAQTSGAFNVNVFCHKPATARAERERDWLRALKPLFQSYDAEPPSSIMEIYTTFAADQTMLDLFLETRPAVVSFHFGLPPADAIAKLHGAGIVLFSSATNLDEAKQALEAGVDAIVAQGYEGRRPSRGFRSVHA